MTKVHVLVGCLETGPSSELEDPCGRFVGICSEGSCLAFRDLISWRVSETTATGAGAGLTEHSEDGSFPPSPWLSAEIETLAGSER